MRLGFDLILLGAPASGKDTQARLLRRKYAFTPVESGKYWRKIAKQNTAAGRLVRKTSNRGHMTPVFLMKRFILKMLKSAPKNRDLLFVGNPRLKPEAQLLVKLLAKKNRDFTVLFIDLPVAEVIKRAKARPGYREDDNYVKTRVSVNKTHVRKTIKYFQSLGKLKFIKGNKPVNRVFKDIVKAINDYQRQRAN